MKKLDHNALYRYYILLIVYSYILPCSILCQSLLSSEEKLFDNDDYNNRKQIHVYFDGLCQPVNSGGIACFGFIIKNGANIIHREYGRAANNSTNNVAEYTGVIKALEWLIANNYQNESIVINGDSQLVIQQIKRNFKVKAPS